MRVNFYIPVKRSRAEMIQRQDKSVDPVVPAVCSQVGDETLATRGRCCEHPCVSLWSGQWLYRGWILKGTVLKPVPEAAGVGGSQFATTGAKTHTKTQHWQLLIRKYLAGR